jgi:hypothetical protein
VRESDDSSENDEEIDRPDYRPEPEEDADDPASSGTRDARFQRIELARECAAQNGIADVLEVRTSIHAQSCEHPEWYELEGREKSLRVRGKNETEFWEAPLGSRKQREPEGDLETSFLLE